MTVIPKPLQVTALPGSFIWKEELIAGHNSLAETFSRLLQTYAKRTAAAGEGRIRLVLESQSGEGSYRLRIKPQSIEAFGSESGLLCALMTLLQMLTEGPEIPCMDVEDRPRFAWRGAMLDTARSFFPVSFIKKWLDLMAIHKLNKFHWHLTDDQGWRLESKKYPRLTAMASKRLAAGTAYLGQIEEGFYTQNDIKEIVAYAARLHIEVIPEIDVPGHSTALFNAYPEFSCRKMPLPVTTDWGIFPNNLCAGDEGVYRFLEELLSEAAALFPSQYFHMGGDEVLKDYWQACPACRQLIQRENLTDFDALQNYFTRRVNQIIKGLGKTTLGWDEILEGGPLPEDIAVMSWRGEEGGAKAAASNCRVIMCPTQKLYLNCKNFDDAMEPGRLGVCPIEGIFLYEPVPGELKHKEKLFLGVQANLWTEAIAYGREAEYFVFPRLCAVAEVAWQTDRDALSAFAKRLALHERRLYAWDVNFCKTAERLAVIAGRQ